MPKIEHVPQDTGMKGDRDEKWPVHLEQVARLRGRAVKDIGVGPPVETGLEAASQLTRKMPNVVVVLTSAFEAEGVWRASQEGGAFAFVMKEHITPGNSPST